MLGLGLSLVRQVVTYVSIILSRITADRTAYTADTTVYTSDQTHI